MGIIVTTHGGDMMAVEAINSPSSTLNTTTNVGSSMVSTHKNTEVAADTSAAKSTGGNHPYDSNDPYQVKDTQNVSTEDIKKAVGEINQKIRMTHTSCQYSYHEDTNRISITVINEDTDEVIREIPPEKTLNMIAKVLELEGILVDEKR